MMQKSEMAIAVVCGILVLAAVFPTLSVQFYREGEAREAEVTADIVINGNVVAPYPGRIPTKPFALHWLSAIIASFGGLTEFALRLSTLVYFAASVIFLFLLAKKLYGNRIAVMSCLIFAVFPLAVKYSTMYRVDMALCAFTVASLYFLVWGVSDGSKCLLFTAGALCGIGFISKGPVIYATVLLPAILWIVINKTPVLSRGTSLFFTFLGFLAGTAVVAAWAMLALRIYGAGGLEVLADESFLRFADTQAHGEHFKRPIYWYLPTILAATFPFGSAFLLGLVEGTARLGRAFILRRFEVVASLAGLIFFSLSTYKRGVYLLPVFPLMALVSARVLCGDEFSVTKKVFGFTLVIVAGILLAVAYHINFGAEGQDDVRGILEQIIKPAMIQSQPLLHAAGAGFAIASVVLAFCGLSFMIETRTSCFVAPSACACAIVIFSVYSFLGFGSAEIPVKESVAKAREMSENGKIMAGFVNRDHAVWFYSEFNVETVTDIAGALNQGKRILLLEDQLAGLKPGTFISEFVGYSSSGSNDKMYIVRKR